MKSKNRKSFFGTLFCVFLAVAGSATAQENPRVEIAGNYTYIHISSGWSRSAVRGAAGRPLGV